MSEFKYEPAAFIPFKDPAVIERIRNIKREDITKHHNPDYKISIIADDMAVITLLFEMFYRIKTAMDAGEQCVLIMANPWPHYRILAMMLNRYRVNCAKLHTFNMDEYADQDGNIAPETWPLGFNYAFKKFFYYELDDDLRPPEHQIHGPSNENIRDYGKMISDLGEADFLCTGPGWSGHIAFVEPDAPEFHSDSLEEWRMMGPRIVTLSPITIAQNSLHGTFGMSGDLARVPPKAATIGPAQIVRAKNRMQIHGISVRGTTTSWQRFISRLAMHGPVTPLVPESICQTLKTRCYVTETSAMDIQPDWEVGY